MKTTLLFLLFFTASHGIAQKLPREILNGQLLSETGSLEGILITNKTANFSTVSQNDGSFRILVRTKDTLVFSGLNFPRQILVLNESDLKFSVLNVPLQSQATNLEEVVINRNALSGNLKEDSENIKITQIKIKIDNLAVMDQLFEDDLKSAPENKLMPGYVDKTYMADFVKIGSKLARVFTKKKPQKDGSKELDQFSLVVQNRFSKQFFRNNLKIAEAQIGSFLNFCENDPKAQELIAKADDFELIQFLIEKRLEFLALKKD
ncbi:hypothetical protein [Flavobacterium tegetincola]|uniref:hypothetical protein n=1 Tax=Flavobacterium tegetincola TaxID=150172 RepID=UPI0004005016|nr:hypothetical protein [Flavobacterium tegetincola]